MGAVTTISLVKSAPATVKLCGVTVQPEQLAKVFSAPEVVIVGGGKIINSFEVPSVKVYPDAFVIIASTE